jgi:hypothetical protein
MGHWNRVARVRDVSEGLLGGWTEEEAVMRGRFWVEGEALTAHEIVARLEKSRHAHDYVGMCRVVLAHAIAKRDEQLEQEQKFQRGLTAILQQEIGADWKRLAKYGITPPKARRRLTSEELAIAHDRSLKTRAKRGTRSSKQRRAITTEPKLEVRVVGLPGSTPDGANAPAEGESGGRSLAIDDSNEG